MKRITLSIRSLAAAAVALTLLVGGVSAAASGSITKKMIDKLYKYSSDRQQFNLIPAKTMSVSVGALSHDP